MNEQNSIKNTDIILRELGLNEGKIAELCQKHRPMDLYNVAYTLQTMCKTHLLKQFAPYVFHAICEYCLLHDKIYLFKQLLTTAGFHTHQFTLLEGMDERLFMNVAISILS